MIIYIIKRIFLIIPTIFGIFLINYSLSKVILSKPAYEAISRINNYLSDDKDKISDHYMGNISKMQKFEQDNFFVSCKKYLSLDFGDSYFRGEKVNSLIFDHLLVSITLALISIVLTWLIALIITFNSRNYNAKIRSIYYIPGFFISYIFMIVFSKGGIFPIFPLKGLISENFESMSYFNKAKDILFHSILPVSSLILSILPRIIFLVKNTIAEEMKKQYILFAFSKGFNKNYIIYKYILKNITPTLISNTSQIFLKLIYGSTLMVEIIYSINGIGSLLYESTISRDYPLMLGSLFALSFIGVMVNFFNEIFCFFLNPIIKPR